MVGTTSLKPRSWTGNPNPDRRSGTKILASVSMTSRKVCRVYHLHRRDKTSGTIWNGVWRR